MATFWTFMYHNHGELSQAGNRKYYVYEEAVRAAEWQAKCHPGCEVIILQGIHSLLAKETRTIDITTERLS